MLSSVFFVTDSPRLLSYDHSVHTLGNNRDMGYTHADDTSGVHSLSPVTDEWLQWGWGTITRTEPGDISVIDDHTFSCAVLELRQTGVYFMAPRHLAYLGEDCFALLCNYVPCGGVVDTTQHCALHDCSAFIIFDVPRPYRSIERYLFREPLLLEVPDCKIVRIGQEVHHVWICTPDMVFEVVH